MATVNNAWIFDIDGVVSESQILLHIADKLKDGEPVAFNTERSLSWTIEQVINPLLDIIEGKNVLENFIAVSEKGRCWVTFDKDGTMQKHKNDSSLVSEHGKGIATERILSLFNEKGIEPKEFIAFSDSPSDIEMAKKLHKRNLAFTFIFVDNNGELKGRKLPLPIVFAKK